MIPEPHLLAADAPIPLYRQLKSWIVAGIRSGGWPPDTPLPSERTLSQNLEISRATVRRAIDDLEQEGWVARRQGRGTFVTHPAPLPPPAQFDSFSDQLQRTGHTPGSQLLHAQLEEASDSVARALELQPGQIVAAVARLELADGKPLILERSHLPHALTPQLLEQDLSGPLHRLLGERYRLDLHSSEETLKVIRAKTWVTKALGIKKKRPLLYSERIVRDRAGIPLEYAQRYARADACSFQVKLVGGGGADFVLRGRDR